MFGLFFLEVFMESAGNYFDEWLKAQERLLGAFSENVKKLQDAYISPGGVREGLSASIGKNAVKSYNAWMRSMSHYIPESREYPLGLIKDALLKSANGSNIYAKLYEVWLPLFQAIEEKAIDISSYKDFIDPVKYKEIIDQVFGLSPELVTEFYAEAYKVFEAWSISTREFVEPWAEGMENNIKTMPQFMQGHPDSLMNIFHHAYESYDKSFGKFLHIHAVGKDREKIELILRGFDDLTVYMTRYVKYQQMMYVTGLKAVEKLIETLALKIKQDEIKSFNEFCDLWMDVSEKKYLELGRTEEYSKVQGELLNAALQVRQHYFKLMELYLYDVPVALRSEMDDLYKNLYEMKKKVKALERRIGELSAGEAAA